ncbi:endoplasmic reticulum retention protein [Tulasnella sp. 425]|nr:endoplasmic reticulum retention protein [Tulasnella sp. 425]
MDTTAAVGSSQDPKPRITSASNANPIPGETPHPHYQTQQVPIAQAENDLGGFSAHHFVNVVDGVPRGGGVPAWYGGFQTQQALVQDCQPGSSRQPSSSYDPVNNYISSLPSFDYEWSEAGSSSSIGSPGWSPQMPLQSPGRGREYRVSGEEDEMELDSEIGDSVSLRGGSPTRPPSEERNSNQTLNARVIKITPCLVDGRLLREVYGRAFNSSVETYLLPADDEEQSRLDLQHHALVCFLGGLFPWPDKVREALRPQPGYTPGILDIGTGQFGYSDPPSFIFTPDGNHNSTTQKLKGSGIWAIQMARKYPHAEVVGLDLAPPLVPLDSIPENCRFELDDANLSLSHYANSFDVVHARASDPGIKDFDTFLYNMAEILRPGGVLILGSGDPQFYDENVEPLPIVSEGQPRFRWIQRVFAAVYSAYKGTGAIVDWPRTWHKLIEGNPNYEHVTTWQMKMPLGPWPQGLSMEHKRGSILLRNNLINILGSFTPLLLQDGYKLETIERWKQPQSAPKYLIQTAFWSFDTGDLAHLASIFILIHKIQSTRSCRGISFKSQCLYVAVFVARYLDLFWNYVSLYNSLMKVFFIASSCYIVFLMRVQFRPTNDPSIDTFKVEYIVVPSVILSLIFNYEFIPSEILWSFSIYLESVAILPQLFLLQRTGEAETITTHYLAALGAYRALYIPNWIYRYWTEGAVDVIAVLAGLVQTGLFADFFYVYFTKYVPQDDPGLSMVPNAVINPSRVLKGEKFELPA